MNDDNVIGGKQKVVIFLSLNNIIDYEKIYYINVSICNDKLTNIFNDLGETEKNEGMQINFSSSFVFDYFFEKEQILRFYIYSESILIAELKTTVGKLMGSRNSILTLSYEEDGNNIFELIINGKNALESKILSNIQISAQLKPKIKVGRPSIYFCLSNINDNINWRYVYKSGEYSSYNINFDPVSISLDSLCAGDRDRPIRISFHDEEIDIIGQIEISYITLKNERDFPIQFNNEHIGNFQIKITESKDMRFLDYIKGGMEINLIVAVDFTSSNGNVNDPKSLHFIRGVEPNSYERAIKECSNIVAYYDMDQLFPVYGFGAILPGNRETSHCFPLTFCQNAEVKGIDEIINSYKNALSIVSLNGPTYFSHLIREVIKIVQIDIEKKDIYYILMILTDGQINDMQATIDALVEASIYPLSVIIIGIGNADFSNMHILGKYS